MADIRLVQQVRSGITTEYYGVIGQSSSISASDKLIMSFDAEITIDELIVSLDAGADVVWDLDIVYPQTSETRALGSHLTVLQLHLLSKPGFVFHQAAL